MYNMRISDLNKLKQRLRMEWVKLDHVFIAAAIHPFVRGVIDSSRSVMPVLYIFYTVSCNISHPLLSTGLKFGEFGGHS